MGSVLYPAKQYVLLAGMLCHYVLRSGITFSFEVAVFGEGGGNHTSGHFRGGHCCLYRSQVY